MALGNTKLSESLPTDAGGGGAVSSLAARWRIARERYGSRAFAILFYRICFQWPRLRAKAVRLKLRLLLRSEIAATVRFGKHVFVTVPGGFLAIGDRTFVGDRCFIEVSPNPHAEVRIGAHCYFAHDIHIGAYREITIGDNVRVAEFVSLRDSSHNYQDRSRYVYQQGDSMGQLRIGNDVWIGKGAIILGSPAGTVIGNGVVIGAHSVVKESIPDYAIAVGAPARIVGYRRDI